MRSKRGWQVMAWAVLALVQGCAAARPVLSDPTEGCMDRRVFARGTTRPELAPGVVALYRRPPGLGVVKLQHLKGGGGFPFEKAGFEVPDIKTRGFEVKLHSQPAMDSVFTWGLVDACGRFVTEPHFSFIDVRADGGGLAYEMLKTGDGESELKVWVVDLGKGELRPAEVPGLEYAEMLADQTVFFRRKLPKGHQALVSLADFGAPGTKPIHELTDEADLGFETTGPARIGGYSIHQLQARAMAHFERPQPAHFFFARRSPRYLPPTYVWFDRQGRNLLDVFGGDVVEFAWNHFVVRSRSAADTYSLRDAQGALVVPEYRGRPPQFGKDFALVEEASGARRYFDFELKPLEESRALALVEERRVREAADAKRSAEDYVQLVKRRQEEAALMAKVHAEQQRVAAVQAEEARKVAEAEAAKKRTEAEAQRRREEELRSVHYMEGNIVLATNALPKGWPQALARPAKSMTGHYSSSDTGCDIQGGEGNEIRLLCMRFVKKGNWLNESTSVFKTDDRPTPYRIRSVQRSNYSFDHVSSGGPEYKLSIGDERILLVYWEKQGTFHIRIDNHRLEKTSEGLAWGRLF